MDWRITLDGKPSRRGFSRTDTLILVVVCGFIIMLLLPMLTANRGGSRGAPRRIQCRNNLKQIGLAIHNYAQAHRVFPPGTICSTDPIEPGNQYDVWAEAAQSGPGFHGTSFLLRIMPFIEGDNIAKNWNFAVGISSNDPSENDLSSNYDIAGTDVKGFYCPTRRWDIRGEDKAMLLSPSWTGGGTDYGGCAGRHAAFTLNTGYNLCDASTFYEPNFYPEPFTAEDDTEEKRWGIFGRVNVSTTFSEIRDGTSNTIMTGELQRITDITPGSKDGWAIGGPATLFTTGAMVRYDGNKLEFVARPGEGKLMNNHFFGSPGSEHPCGAQFGMGDGSVRFIADSIDPRIFALMGSMADGEEVSLDD